MAYRLTWLICTWKVLGTLPSIHFYFFTFISLFLLYIIYFIIFYSLLFFYYFTWNGPKMFVDLDWPTNASSPFSASAELLVCFKKTRVSSPGENWYNITLSCDDKTPDGTVAIKSPTVNCHCRRIFLYNNRCNLYELIFIQNTNECNNQCSVSVTD